MDEDVILSEPVDKFLTGMPLPAGEQAGIRERIGAASADDVTALEAVSGAHSADIDALETAVATLEDDVAENTSDIDALETAVASVAGDVAAVEAAVAEIELAIESTVAGVASVAGETGVITANELRAAINVENGADVTDAANVAAAIAGTAEKTTPADDDKIPTLDSAAGGALKWFKVSSIASKIQSTLGAVFASIAQGNKADSAVQPLTDAELASLQLTPVALEDLPDAAVAGAGVLANINDGSVATIGAVALPGGELEQRVRSDGAYWRVDSGAEPVSDHGGMEGLEDDDHLHYMRVDGERAGTGIQEFAGVNFKDPTVLTLDAGVVVATQTLHFIAAQTGTADDLDTLTAAKGVGDFVVVSADAGDTITIKHATGNISTFNGQNVVITPTSMAFLLRMGENWLCLANNAPGGGGGGGLDPTINVAVGAVSNALSFRNAADYSEGEGVSWRDVNFHLWDYVLRAGTLPGGEVTSIDLDTNVMTGASMSSLVVGDRVSFVQTDTLAAPLTPHVSYHVISKPTSTSMTVSDIPGGGAVNLTTAGAGTLYWVRHDAPVHVIPKDYNPVSNAFYWQLMQAPWRVFNLPFLVFPDAAVSGHVLLQRATYGYDILGWGMSCAIPVATPGSGAAQPMMAALRKTGPADSTISGTNLLGVASLGLGSYHTHVSVSKPEAVPSVAAGEALYLYVSPAGDIPPQGVEVHLVCRTLSPFPGAV